MKKFKTIASIFLLIILFPILFVSSVILIDSYINPDEVPSFFGWKPFIVLSDSMKDTIKSGDIAIVKEVDINNIKENDIIAFKEEEIVIIHRIIDIAVGDAETRYITKGDNNDENDINYVLENQIEGLYQFKIARLGNFAMFLQTPIGLIICLSIPALFLIIMQTIENNKQKKLTISKNEELKREIEKLKNNNWYIKRDSFLYKYAVKEV